LLPVSIATKKRHVAIDTSTIDQLRLHCGLRQPPELRKYNLAKKGTRLASLLFETDYHRDHRFQDARKMWRNLFNLPEKDSDKRAFRFHISTNGVVVAFHYDKRVPVPVQVPVPVPKAAATSTTTTVKGENEMNELQEETKTER
jgi:hypothetical protein